MKKAVSFLAAAVVLVGAATSAAAATELTGEGKGIGGAVKVKVVKEGDKITAVEVVSHSETPGISDPAIKKVPADIVAKNSADVATVSGATVTSNAIKNAVKAALASEKPAAPAAEAKPATPAPAASKVELTGEGKGIGGAVKVKVVKEGDKITSVTVVSHSETPGISDPAIKKVPADIVAKNSADVATVSGATVTSNAIKNAVKAALASEKPATPAPTKPATPAPAKPAAPQVVAVDYKIFGQTGKVDVTVVNGDVYVGVRSAAKALGGEVSFDSATKQAVVKYKTYEAKGQAGQKGITVNGKAYTLAAPVVNVNGNLYVQAYAVTKIAGEIANKPLTVTLVKNVLEVK